MNVSSTNVSSTKESGNAASGIKGCDAVWPYDPDKAYLGMKEWAEMLLAERDALREGLEEIKERCADGDPLTSIWNAAQVTLNRPE